MSIEDVITDSISDAELPTEETVATEEVVEQEASPVEGSETAEASTEDSAEESDVAVASPAAKATAKPEDDEFAKRFGVPKISSSGRENRLPHSRVVQMVKKAEKEVTDRLTTEHTKTLGELDTKVRTYESQLAQVSQFEDVMVNDQEKFVNMLLTVPGYKETFQKLFGGAQEAPGAPNAAVSGEDMPQPDEQQPDGSAVYSLKGLQAVLDWHGKKVMEKAVSQIQERYAPIENEWQTQQYLNKVVPVIQNQISEARKWPQFNENEAGIVQALQADPNLSLEGAYVRVVTPKLTSSREQMYQEFLETQKRTVKPSTTSAPVVTSRPQVQRTSSGKRDIEDIIREATQGLKQ